MSLGRRAWPRAVGGGLLLTLFFGSLALTRLFPGALARHCPLGSDALRPDHSVCELVVGGLSVSLVLALLAALAAVAFGLVVAWGARALGGLLEQGLIRGAEAFFALPDVLVLMVLELAGQTLGELNPRLQLSPFSLMVLALALMGWASPARILHSRIATLEQEDYVMAARAMGATRLHLLRFHLLPALVTTLTTLFLARLPAAILAESTVSFLGVSRLEPWSLGRYLGTSYSAILYSGGWRIVGPAWAVLVLVVLGAALISTGERASGQPVPGSAQRD